MEGKGIQFINKELPDSVCVQVYGMAAFPTMLSKLSDLWTGVIMPKGLKEEDKLPWCIAYFQYQIESEVSYLIWFFDNSDPLPADDNKIIKEVKQFLGDQKEERNK